jgi:anti-sigma regulatory factor (Ser/Thr protein kinase)
MEQAAAQTLARLLHAVYPAEPAQVRNARKAVAGLLGDTPVTDDALLIVSEFATNAVLHSASRSGGTFTLRAEITGTMLRIEVGDGGGGWNRQPYQDGRPHGLDVIEAVTGALNWGITGDDSGRTAWAHLTIPRTAG